MQAIQSAFIGEASILTPKKPRRLARPVGAELRECVGRFLHLGGGRQSSWLVEAMIEGDLEPVDLVIFCDTGCEPSWVYTHVEYLGRRLASAGIPLKIARARSGRGLVDSIMHDRRFVSLPLFVRNPDGSKGRMKRQCTSEYKIEPADDAILEWMLERGHARIVEHKNGRKYRRVRPGVYVEQLYGISLEEFYRAGHRGPAWQLAVYPLIDRRMTAADAVRDLERRGLPVPYKSACTVCPFHDDRYWLELQTRAPAEFEDACAFDDWLRTPAARFDKGMRNLAGEAFLHTSLEPLRSIDFSARLAARAGELLEVCGDHCMT